MIEQLMGNPEILEQIKEFAKDKLNENLPKIIGDLYKKYGKEVVIMLVPNNDKNKVFCCILDRKEVNNTPNLEPIQVFDLIDLFQSLTTPVVIPSPAEIPVEKTEAPEEPEAIKEENETVFELIKEPEPEERKADEEVKNEQ